MPFFLLYSKFAMLIVQRRDLFFRQQLPTTPHNFFNNTILSIVVECCWMLLT